MHDFPIGAVLVAAPHSGRPGLLLTTSRSFLARPSFLADRPYDPHGEFARGAWNAIRAECASLGLPAGMDLSEVERGATECLRAAEASIGRWKLLRRMGPHSSYNLDPDPRQQSYAPQLDATWAWAVGFFNLVIDDGRAQELPDIFYAIAEAPEPEPEPEGEDPNEGSP